MKKNILTIVIMAASIINLVLTAVLIFSVMPAMNKTSNLIDKVASVIDLEIESKNEKNEQTPVENLEVFEIPYETNVNINLQKEAGDEQDHYAVIKGIRVSFDKEADGFSDVKGLIEKNTTYVEDIVKETISSFSSSTISEEKVKEEAVKKLQERYDTKCIVEISLPGFLVS
jgi:hypothetical protein